jgi:hypothetical protein
VRGSEYAYQYLVNEIFAVLDVAIMDGVGLGVGEVFGEDVRKNLKRLGS